MVWKVREKSIRIWAGQGKSGNFFLESLKVRESEGKILNIFCDKFLEAPFLQVC